VKILLGSSFLLFEDTRFGGSRRLLNIGQALAREHDVSVICFDGCREFEMWDRTPPFTKFFAIPFAAKSLWKFRHFLDASRELKRDHEALKAFLDGRDFDCVILGYPLDANLLHLPSIASCPKILYIEGDLIVGQVDAKRQRAANPVERLKSGFRFRQIDRYYRWFLKSVHTFFMSTQTEINAIHNRYPGIRTKQLGHGIDLDTSFTAHIENPAVAGFIGNFHHTPNLDALLWYLEKVHPRLSTDSPHYRLVIAGMNLPAEVSEEHRRDPHITLLGPIQTLDEFYGQISFLVNPIISGRGVRTKVIEAAAYGRPVVSTRLGADGSQPLHVRLGDTAGEFAQACKDIMHRGAPDAEIEANRRIVRDHFSPEGMVRTLLDETD